MKWAILLTMLASASASAETFIVTWTPPTQYEDSTPLLEQDLDYYTLFLDGVPTTSFDSIVGTWTVDLTVTVPGTYDVQLTVTDINGQESVLSNTHVFTVGPRIPKAPHIVVVVAQ